MKDDTVKPVAWSSMAALLEELEALGEEHPELFDTDVRERMWNVIDKVLIKQSADLEVPSDLGMFTPEANQRLQNLLVENLDRLRKIFAVFNLDTEHKRLVSFFNPKLHTEKGSYVDDFFGHP